MHTSVLFIALTILIIVTLVNGIEHTPTIEIQGGSIRGIIETLPNSKKVRRYFGIPYAKAERFKKPVAPDSWTGVKDVTSFGKVCYQLLTPPPFFAGLEEMSEDCLNLNVYAPNTQTSKLRPVMVWIHGGGFLSNSNRISDARQLATLGDVIVVSINYRLCMFGFLASKDYGLEGNYGLYDQLEALKWVQNNIQKFGGDPEQVTIFGNSAGGISISMLSMSPLAKGLFKYAIMQSGVANMPALAYLPYQDKSQLRDYAKEKFGCTDTDMKECLENVDAKDIILAGYGWPSFNFPVIDGTFVTGDPLEIVKNGNAELNPQSVLIGVADDDGSCATDAIPALSDGYFRLFNETIQPNVFLMKDYFELVRQTFTTVGETLNDKYLGIVTKNYNAKGTGITDPQDQVRRIVLDVLKDVMFTAPGVLHANFYDKNNIPTYFYEVKYRMPMADYFEVPSQLNGYHETEKFMMFGYALKSQSESTAAKISKEVIRMWSNFAKSGNPNRPQTSASHVEWPEYKESDKQYLVIQPSMEVKSNLRPDQLAVWNTVLPSLVSDSNPGTKKSIAKKRKIKNKKTKKHKPTLLGKPLLKPILIL